MNAGNIDWALVISLTVLGIAALLIYLKVNLKICEPNEILIFSGRRRKLKTGEVLGYRVIRGGWGIRAVGRAQSDRKRRIITMVR